MPLASPQRVRRRILTFGLVVAGVFGLVWVSRYSAAIHRLTRGVGDTVFYDADDRPWFRMDEQRRDVPLDELAPDLKYAVIAIEDHRFPHHGGIDPIGLGRALWHDVRSGGRSEGGS